MNGRPSVRVITSDVIGPFHNLKAIFSFESSMNRCRERSLELLPVFTSMGSRCDLCRMTKSTSACELRASRTQNMRFSPKIVVAPSNSCATICSAMSPFHSSSLSVVRQYR